MKNNLNFAIQHDPSTELVTWHPTPDHTARALSEASTPALRAPSRVRVETWKTLSESEPRGRGSTTPASLSKCRPRPPRSRYRFDSVLSNENPMQNPVKLPKTHRRKRQRSIHESSISLDARRSAFPPSSSLDRSALSPRTPAFELAGKTSHSEQVAQKNPQSFVRSQEFSRVETVLANRSFPRWLILRAVAACTARATRQNGPNPVASLSPSPAGQMTVLLFPQISSRVAHSAATVRGKHLNESRHKEEFDDP